MKSHKGIRPQDIAILLYISQYADGVFKMKDVALTLNISQSEVSESINRSHIAGLIDTKTKLVFRYSLYEFLVFGLRYVFPILPGPVVKGIPTAHSGPPLNTIIKSDDDQYVWKSSEGTLRGMAIEPLYSTLPSISVQHPKFYEVLCLIDALRIGKVREVNLARDLLRERLIIV